MKNILLLTFIVYIKSYIPSYYSSCVNPPSGGFSSFTTSECRKHNPSNGHCCLLSYNVQNGDHKDTSTYEECIGITQFGYDNIYDLEVDIEEDKNLDSVNIYCISTILDLFYRSLILFILNIN